VKVDDKPIYTPGDVCYLTPNSKNYHRVVALEDLQFVDIVLPFYDENNPSNNYIEIQENGKLYLTKIPTINYDDEEI
jgi:hypothetical protein